MLRVLAIALLVGCGGPPPVATAADAERSHVTLEELAQGRSLLLSRCSGCHRTPVPKDYAPDKWPHQIDKMVDRAKLDVNERRAIETYLVALAHE